MLCAPTRLLLNVQGTQRMFAKAAWNYMRCAILMQQDIECLRLNVRGNTKRLPHLLAFGTSYWRLVSKINLPEIYQLIQIRKSHKTKGHDASKERSIALITFKIFLIQDQ